MNTEMIIIYLLVNLGAQFVQFFLFHPKLNSQTVKGVVSRNAVKLVNYKMLVKSKRNIKITA